MAIDLCGFLWRFINSGDTRCRRPMGWVQIEQGKFCLGGVLLRWIAIRAHFRPLHHLSHVGVISAVLTRRPADSANGSDRSPASPPPQTPTRLAQDFCAVLQHISLANTLYCRSTPRPISFAHRDYSGPLVSLAACARCPAIAFLSSSRRGPPPA